MTHVRKLGVLKVFHVSTLSLPVMTIQGCLQTMMTQSPNLRQCNLHLHLLFRPVKAGYASFYFDCCRVHLSVFEHSANGGS